MYVSHLTIRRYHCGNPFTNILHPMRHSTLLAILALLASVTAVRAQPADSLLLQAKQMLRVGESEGKSDMIQQARATFERATADENLATLAHYYAAYAAHHLVNLLTSNNPDIPKRELFVHIDYAILHLEEATQRDPSFAEGWALLASVYGRKIGLRPLLGMTLGQKSRRAQQTAVGLAPNNPAPSGYDTRAKIKACTANGRRTRSQQSASRASQGDRRFQYSQNVGRQQEEGH